jgi:hypothetical protein
VKYPIKMESPSTSMHTLFELSANHYPYKENSQPKECPLHTSYDFNCSQTSTDASSDNTGCFENDCTEHSSWAPLIEEDMPIRKVRSAMDEELQSLLEVEEELQSIWRPQAKKLKLRTLGGSPVH